TTKLEPGLAQGMVAELRARMAFGEIRGVSGDLVSDDTVFDILLVRQAEMLLGRDVAEHGAAVPADHGRANATRDVIVTRRNIGRERTKGIKRGFIAMLELQLHIFLD